MSATTVETVGGGTYAARSSELASSESLELQASGENLDALLDCIPLDGVRFALDVGCGTGALTRALAQRLPAGSLVHGIDRSADHIASARRASEARGIANTSFVQGDFLDAQLGASFNLVLCRYVLMYVIPQGAAVAFLERMRRCIDPPGRVVCFEADVNFGQDRYPEPPRELAEVLGRLVAHYRERGEIEWRAGTRLHHYLRRAGFARVDVVLADARTIRGGSPRALAEHDSQDVEHLIAPLVAPERRAAVADLWRRYLLDADSFVYTPVFAGIGSVERETISAERAGR